MGFLLSLGTALFFAFVKFRTKLTLDKFEFFVGSRHISVRLHFFTTFARPLLLQVRGDAGEVHKISRANRILNENSTLS